MKRTSKRFLEEVYIEVVQIHFLAFTKDSSVLQGENKVDEKLLIRFILLSDHVITLGF